MDIAQIHRDIKNGQFTDISNMPEFLVCVKHIYSKRRSLFIEHKELSDYLFANIERYISDGKLEYEDMIFKLMHDIFLGDIPDNYCTSCLISNVLDKSSFTSIEISDEWKEYLTNIKTITSMFYLLIDEYSDEKTEFYYELLFKYSESIILDVNDCFRKIILAIKNLESKNFYSRYKIFANGTEMSLTGLILYNISLFDEIESERVSEGVYSILRIISSLDLNFVEEFRKSYTKTKDHLDMLTYNNNVENFFE